MNPIETIKVQVANEFGLTIKDFCQGKGRYSNAARATCMYCLKKLLGINNKEISNNFSVTRQNVDYHIRRVSEYVEDPNIFPIIPIIVNKISNEFRTYQTTGTTA